MRDGFSKFDLLFNGMNFDLESRLTSDLANSTFDEAAQYFEFAERYEKEFMSLIIIQAKDDVPLV